MEKLVSQDNRRQGENRTRDLPKTLEVLQTEQEGSVFTLKMKAIYYSETLVNTYRIMCKPL
jgi:hypothetical protein